MERIVNQLVKEFFNKDIKIDDLKKLYDSSLIYSVHQKHSNIIYEIIKNNDPVDVSKIEADAMIAHNLNCILCIKTADCLPILIFSKELKCFAAVHAGWRGVLSEILSKCLYTLKLRYKELKGFELHIGPHIQQNSFEVDQDVLIKFQELAAKLNIVEFYSVSSNKYHINLQHFAIRQAILAGIDEMNIFTSSIDTKTDISYNSFRRDKEKSARNLSCVGFIK
jgi:YfiH family protein